MKTKEYVWHQNKDYVGGATCWSSNWVYFQPRKLLSEHKAASALLPHSYQGEPHTQPLSCYKPWQPTIYEWSLTWWVAWYVLRWTELDEKCLLEFSLDLQPKLNIPSFASKVNEYSFCLLISHVFMYETGARFDRTGPLACLSPFPVCYWIRSDLCSGLR